MPNCLEQWRHPNHPEFAEKKIAWRFFNAVTEILKKGALHAIPRRSQALHDVLDACGLVTADPKADAPQDAPAHILRASPIAPR